MCFWGLWLRQYMLFGQQGGLGFLLSGSHTRAPPQRAMIPLELWSGQVIHILHVLTLHGGDLSPGEGRQCPCCWVRAASESQLPHCQLKSRVLGPSLFSTVEVLLARKALLPPLVGSSAPECSCLFRLPQNLH